MPRELKVAVIQMDSAPAPRSVRLSRAAKQLSACAKEGAHLAVLPELFSLGYIYDEENYAQAEPIDTSESLLWMRAQAKKHKLYVCGSVLIVDGDHVYNSAFLVAPDGQTWRYDKHYPFAMERAYFRDGASKLTIAETPLGNIGMMICWDAAHAELWERYAGKIDLLLIPSCPPDLHRAVLSFPDGTRYPLNSVDHHFADADIDAQAAWLGIPVAHVGGSGKFQSPLPMPLLSLVGLASINADLLQRWRDADQARYEADYALQTKIIGADGRVLARVLEQGDHYALTTLELPDESPRPQGEQPAIRTSRRTYLMVDGISQALYSYVYVRGLRRQWGANMAARDPKTLWWGASVALVALFAFLLGRRTRD